MCCLCLASCELFWGLRCALVTANTYRAFECWGSYCTRWRVLLCIRAMCRSGARRISIRFMRYAYALKWTVHTERFVQNIRPKIQGCQNQNSRRRKQTVLVHIHWKIMKPPSPWPNFLVAKQLLSWAHTTSSLGCFLCMCSELNSAEALLVVCALCISVWVLYQTSFPCFVHVLFVSSVVTAHFTLHEEGRLGNSLKVISLLHILQLLILC